MFGKDFNKKKSELIWDKTFGVYTNSGFDVFGRKVYHDQFVCAMILPKELGGKPKLENAVILHPLSYKEKGIDIRGIVNSRKFMIEKGGDTSIGILKVLDAVDSKEDTSEEKELEEEKE